MLWMERFADATSGDSVSPMRIRGVIASLLLLAACGGGDDRPPRPSEPQRPQPSAPPSAELRQCLAGLDSAGVEYRVLPDRHFDNGCPLIGTIQLRQVGTPTRNLGAITCPAAAAYARWTREVLQPAAQRRFGEQVTMVETMGTYSCRNIAGTGRLSEHSLANAIDIAAFTLSDGRRITVLDDWNGGDGDERAFLRELHQGGCRTFNIVLGPDANADHRNHFHFDMGSRGPYCR